MPLVTINLVVLNGEKYIRHCLNSVKNQTDKNFEVNILDNGSKDKTKEIAKNEFPEFRLIEFPKNYGMWGGQEKALEFSNSKYILSLSADVILDPKFIEESVKIFEKDPQIGAIQAKIYKYSLNQLEVSDWQLAIDVVDTCGFQIFKSRRVLNIGHGEKDRGQFNEEKEIFAVEGAAPIFRRDALENCRIPVSPPHPDFGDTEIMDHDMWWYGDDVDLGWRMNLFGWKQIYSPNVIAYHDRQTTKNAKEKWYDYFFRIKQRQQIPIKKRRLDWRNLRFTILKNDYTVNILKDLPYFLKREIMVLGYALLFEPRMLLEIPKFFKLLPKILGKRREIMKRAKASPQEVRRWFH